jgi:hypothetical protein
MTGHTPTIVKTLRSIASRQTTRGDASRTMTEAAALIEDMLEALRGCEIALSEAKPLLKSVGLSGCSDIMERHAEKARAALAKATGAA